MVQVAAEGVAHPGVAKGTERAVEEEGVVMEGQEVMAFRQLQDVHTPRDRVRTTSERDV